MENIEKIGIMGGTFDPIHFGHLMIAENARQQYGLSKVIFVPTGHSPHKCKQHVTKSFHRCQMVSLAIADNPYFFLNKVEVETIETSYTYLTLKKLKKFYIHSELYFILGADSLFDFESWREPEAILSNCKILAAYRKHEYQEKFFQKINDLNQKYSEKFFPLDTPSLEVSSKDIRTRLQSGKTIRYLVPREVEAYIGKYHLYKDEVLEYESAGNREKTKKGIG